MISKFIFSAIFVIVLSLTFTGNPMVSLNLNGLIKEVLAESSPVKVLQGRNSETWLLPDGNFVSKLGGEADISFFDNSTNSWKPSKVTSLDSDSFKVQSGLISTIFDNDIIHYDMNMTVQVSRETPMLYHKVVKDYVIVPMVLEERTVSTSSESSFETVAGIVVDDPKEITDVNEVYSTEFGDFLIKYTYKDGKPLKHTFSLVPSPLNENEVFSFIHDFELLNYNNEEVKSDKVEVIDGLTKEITDPMISDEEIISGQYDAVVLDKLIDLKTIRLVETQTNEIIDELNSAESLILQKSNIITVNPDGDDSAKIMVVDGNNNFLLGEIIAETTLAQSWEKFKEVRMDNAQINPHVQFVYGDWIGSFELDPDTYSSNNPTIDGDIATTPASGVSCSTPTTIDSASARTLVVTAGSGDVASCYRSFFEYDISSIPDAVDVSNTVFKFELYSIDTAKNCDYNEMNTKPSIGTASSIWEDIGNGTTFVNNDSTCTTVATNKSVDLGANADSDVEAQLSSNWFAIGIKHDSEARVATNYQQNIRSEEGVGVPDPTLEITYGLPTPQRITADVNENDGITALTSRSIVVTNGTSQTYSLNSTGFAVMSGLKSFTNHNFTIYDTDNFIVNRTINFQPTANETKSFDTDIFRVSCGSGNDAVIKVNETDAHYKTSHSTPICTGGIILWNSTFTKLGNYMGTATNFTSKMISNILDLTNYNANPTLLTVNGTTISTSYSSPNVTSSSFNIANGSRSVFLNFALTLGSTPVVGGGDGGSGGSSGGGGIENLPTQVSNALLLNLGSKTFSHSLGEKRTYSLELLWDKTKEFSLTVNDIKIGQGSFDSLSIVPELLPLTGKKIVDGKGEIFLTVNAPGDRCDQIQITARCVYVKTYTIPVTVSVTDLLGTSYPDIPAVLTISIVEKFPIGLAIVVILLFAVPYPIARIISQNSKKSARKSPKQMQKDHQKATKKSEKMERKQAKHDMNLFKKIKKEF